MNLSRRIHASILLSAGLVAWGCDLNPRPAPDLSDVDVVTRSVTWQGQEGQARMATVPTGFLDGRGIEPVFGRLFPSEEWGSLEQCDEVVLSYEYWQQTFGGHPNVLGRELLIDGETKTIVGVLPEGATGEIDLFECEVEGRKS